MDNNTLNQSKQHTLLNNRSLVLEAALLLSLMCCAAIMSFNLIQRNPNVTGDGLQYTSVVFNWLQGYGYKNLPNMSWLTEPGYGLLTYAVNIIVNNIELAGMLVSLIAYVLLIPAVYFCTKAISSRFAASIAALLVTFYPYLLTFSWLNLTDSAYTFFLFISFFAAVRLLYVEHKWLSAVMMGLFLGYAALIRPEGYGVAVLSILAIFLIQAWVYAKQKEKKVTKLIQTWKYTVASLFLFLLMTLPFLFFIHQLSGVWVISPKISNLVTPSQPSNASELPTFMAENAISITTAGAMPQLNSTNQTAANDEQNTAAPMSSAAPTDSKKPALNVLPLTFSRIGENMMLWWSYFCMMCLQPAFPLAVLALLLAGIKLIDITFSNNKQQKTSNPKAKNRSRHQSSHHFLKEPYHQLEKALKPENKPMGLLIKLLPLFFAYFSIAAVYLTTNLMYRYFLPYMMYIIILLSILTALITEKLFLRLNIKPYWVGFVIVGVLYGFSLTQIGTSYLAEKFSLPNMISIPQAMQIKHLNLGARAAGLWMRDNLSIDKDIFIASSKNTQNGCYLILFQVFHRKFPIQGRCVSAYNQEQIQLFLQAGGDYYILDNDSINYVNDIYPLWENPNLAEHYGLALVYQDDLRTFQIYRNAQKYH